MGTQHSKWCQTNLNRVTFYGLGYTFKANIYPKQDNWTGQIAYGEGKKTSKTVSDNIGTDGYDNDPDPNT